MIDGGKVVAIVGNIEICLYETMRELAAQFAAGGMSIDEYIDALEHMTDDAARKEVSDAHS